MRGPEAKGVLPQVAGSGERGREHPPGRAAYAAFGWALVFLVPHLYWAAGGTAGLPDAQPVDGVLAAINWAAIVLTAVAGALALALVQAWGAVVPRRLLLAGAWTACVLLTLRGAGGLAQGLLGDGAEAFVVAFESLFLVGGVLFGLAAASSRSVSRRPRVPRQKAVP